MRYIIMCGGDYSDKFDIPKPLQKVYGEILVERTIRLLKEHNVDIAISSLSDKYNYLGIEILKHENNYIHTAANTPKDSKHCWLNCYYPTNEPACYLNGDVYYSDDAIKTIVETKVETTMFFAAPGVYDGRRNVNIKTWREPIAFKVQRQDIFRKAINELKEEIDKKLFSVDPICWTLYKKLNGQKYSYNNWNNDIFNRPGNLVVIDDITTDIDRKEDIEKQEYLLLLLKGGKVMVRLKAKEMFTLKRFNETSEIIRADSGNCESGKFYTGDTFICGSELAKYLLNEIENPVKRALVELIEVIPEKEKRNEETTEVKPKRKTTKKVK